MPPIGEVLDALLHAVLPAVVASAAAFALVAKLAPARLAYAAGALALACGFLAGNHFRGAIDYRVDFERPLNVTDLGRALKATFISPSDDSSEEGIVTPPLPYYWLPWTAGLALVAGLAARKTPAVAAWPIRVAAVGVATALAVPSYLRQESPWLLAAFAGTVPCEWVLLERLVRESTPERLRFGPAAVGSAAFFAASLVILHAHSARLADIAVILSAALGAIAAVGALLRADAEAVAPGVAVALPALMLSGFADTFSEVPATAFLLTAAAPLALAPLLLPRVRSLVWPKWTAVAGMLAAAPLFLAVVLAMRAESLSFG